MTASSPLFSSGGTTPNITIQVANTSQNGYLSSADWNTFNGKQNALTIGNLTDAGTDGIVVTNGTGAVIGTGTSLAQHVADTTHNGYLSSTDWNTFNGKQSTLTLGNLTDAGTDGITITGGTGAVVGTGTTISQHVADTTHNGYLSSTDWNTFNGKQASGSYITALTGDVTATGPGSVTATLATVNGNVGSFGSSTAIPSFTVNAKGLITAASTNAVVAPAGTLTGTTLAANVVSSSLTSVGTITTGVWNGTTIDVAHGGTSLTTLTANNVILGNGTSAPTFVAPGTTGNVLTSNGTTWISSPASGGSSNPIQLAQIVTPSPPPSGSNDIYFKTGTLNSSIAFNPSQVNLAEVLITANNIYVGTSLTALMNGTVTSATVDLFYTTSTGTPTGSMFIVLYNDSGGQPGSVLATSNAVNANTLTTSLTTVPFTFVTGPTLTAGTTYHLAFQPSGVTFNGATIQIAFNNGGAPYLGGEYEDSSNGGASWTQHSNFSTLFNLLGTVADDIPYTLNSSGTEQIIGTQTAVFNETQPNGTNGGTFTSGAWQTRVLNTTQASQNWATLAFNQITLVPGTYYLEASAPAYATNSHRTRLQDINNAATILNGTSEYVLNSTGTVTRSFIVGQFTIGASTTYEIQHQCNTTEASFGFGVAASFGSVEIYTTVSITKLS